MQTFTGRTLTSYLLIAGLIAALNATAVAQDDLILWYPFEGSASDVAVDASGNGLDGSIVGAQRVRGKYGKGLDFGLQDEYVEIANVLQPITTIAFWFKPNWDGSDSETYRLFDANTGAIYFIIGKGKGVADRSDTFGFYLEDAADADFQDWETPAAEAIPVADQWYHIATSWDFGAGEAKFYIDGVEVGSQTGLGNFPPLNGNPKIGFNVGVTYFPAGNGANGIIDEFAIFAAVLDAEQIQEVMLMGFAPGAASNANPANEATDVPRDTRLTWAPGEFANTHNVYLGTSFADVNEASASDPRGVSVAEGLTDGAFDPGRLEFGQTYYWRVDEVNGAPDFTVYKSGPWSFTVEPF